MKKRNIIILVIVLVVVIFGISRLSFSTSKPSTPGVTFNSNEKKQDNEISVTLTIDTRILNDLQKEGKVPSNLEKYVDKSGYIANNIKVNVEKGKTIKDILNAYAKENDITVDISELEGMTFVDSINNIGATSTSKMSGWLYLVNNTMPSSSIQDYKLEDGDKIMFVYSNDGGEDIRKYVSYGYAE